ncbi:hypothetical protein DFH09DRAFT_1420151 [Mycena vulgaris]|nr:hypothetical protein DFH09DRAFT_1420151 [Mycena vulgaris]
MRAALFRLDVPLDFVKLWLPQCPPNPNVLPGDIEPGRNLAIHFLASKVEEVIKNEGDVIGWEPDHNVVGPIAANAEQSVLRLIPVILPVDENQGGSYRLVLEHGNFGIHNMSVTEANTRIVTSVHARETGHIVPASCSVRSTNEHWDRLGNKRRRLSLLVRNAYEHARHYFRVTHFYLAPHPKLNVTLILNERAPQYIPAIEAGKDARYVWFAFNTWREEILKSTLGKLRSWADRRWQELVVHSYFRSWGIKSPASAYRQVRNEASPRSCQTLRCKTAPQFEYQFRIPAVSHPIGLCMYYAYPE